MTISELCRKAHSTAKKHGFWEDWGFGDTLQESLGGERQMEARNALGNRLMLIVSELGEALEALRHNDIDSFVVELADVAIRLGDLCGGLNIDLDRAIEAKMAVNENRPYKHDKTF